MVFILNPPDDKRDVTAPGPSGMRRCSNAQQEAALAPQKSKPKYTGQAEDYYSHFSDGELKLYGMKDSAKHFKCV